MVVTPFARLPAASRNVDFAQPTRVCFKVQQAIPHWNGSIWVLERDYRE
jgi:hypothetical protein